MFYVDIDNVAAHRTCVPLHAKTQATPYAIFLSPDEKREVFSGCAMALQEDGTVRLADAGEPVFGLAALDKNDVIDDFRRLANQQVPFAVWQGGPDAYFEIHGGAIAENETPEIGDLLEAGPGGQLVVGDGDPVAQVMEEYGGRLVIRLDVPSSFGAAVGAAVEPGEGD